MVRGRPMNTALPETRGLVQQRKFRAKKAEKIAELESTNRALVEENKQLRTELQLMRDHLLNPNTGASQPVEMERKVDIDGEQIRIQMGVVQGVRDQLESALRSLTAIGGDAGYQSSPLSMTSHTAQTPELPIASTSNSKCCPGPSARPPSSAPRDDYDDDRIHKRQRQASSTSTPLARQSGSPMGFSGTSTIPRPPSSAIHDMSPPIDRRVPPINSAECCLGIVACDERGEIVGWTS